MAQVQSRKSNFYSQKQSIRDELSAPQYLESAGDVLIKDLARKQTNTRTSLQEQLEIVQNFEKGFELNPDNRKGITCLEEYKKHALEQSEPAVSPKLEKIRNLDELMKDTGLTRHELELDLCEKPNSTVSQLYMFAIANKRRDTKSKLASKWCEHPINRLKEIEEECFGQTKKTQGETRPPDDKAKKRSERRNKHRKRKRRPRKGAAGSSSEHFPEPRPPKAPITREGKEKPEASCPRPSLWDVKDMKKWAESKQIGCRPPALYAIKNGEIIKLEEESRREDVT